MPVKKDYARRTFGQITLVSRSDSRPGFWKGQCRCGNVVEKRIDNLTRPGNHTCGNCSQALPPADSDLQDRVRRVEEIVAQLLSRGTCEARETTTASNPIPSDGRFSLVGYDAEGELWESHTLSGRAFFWGTTEEEAAYAARLYLEQIHSDFNRCIITDAELILSNERREEIKSEVGTKL